MKKNVSMPKNALVAVVALCGVLVLALGYLVIISPKQKQISSLNSQTALARQQISDDLSRAATARSATGAPTIKTADIYRLETAMPSIQDMPDLLLQIDQIAKASGVSLQSISPTPSTSSSSSSTTPFTTVSIALTANGNFYSITDLLYRLRDSVYVRNGALEATGRIFSVNSVQLAPAVGALAATISLDTYVYGSTAPASASPGATTTGTTTTTAASGASAAGATP
ncbi:MAG: type 4a pilus biogenesis protein PilO [Gaiellaceae bacterium]